MHNESLQAFRDSARDLLQNADQLQRIRKLRDQTPAFERRVWSEIADAGWLSILVPEIYGGLDLGLREVAAVAEQVGFYLLPEPFIGAGVQPLAGLCAAPDSDLKKYLISEVISGKLLLGLAWQERPGQYDTAKLTARATRDGDFWVLNGDKHFIIPGVGADGWLVAVYDDATLMLIWVPANSAGLSVIDAKRIDGGAVGELQLRGVRIAASNVLSAGAAAEMSIALANDAARIAQSAELLGNARRGLELMLDYLKTREQFGKAIGSFQALQHRAVDAYIQVQLAAACLEDVLRGVETNMAELPALAARAKARCAHAAIFVTRLAIQFYGAMGYTDECPIGFYMKRALALAAWLGNAPQSRQRFFRLQQQSNESLQAGKAARQEADNATTEFPRSADWEAMSDTEFRAIVHGFFKQNYPEKLRFWPRRLRLHEARDWYQILSKQGWLAPSWPQQYGGMGLSPEKLLAFIEESERWGVVRVPDMGIIMAGPILMRYGTPQQIDYYLPKIISGEHIWCQGYSEPNAGSDLASLRTEAVLGNGADGDHFIVNGQKIWTTWGHDATHMFMLVRTDKTVKKQQGISFILVDMKTPGITVRPIVDIAGNEEFCEVFFDNVRVPRADLVGELNQGWTIAKSLLGFERLFVGSPKQSQHALQQLTTLAHIRGLFSDPAFVARYAELQLDVIDLAAVYGEYADMMKRGEELPPSISMLKIWASETYARISMALVEAADEYGADHEPVNFEQAKVNVISPLFISTASTIYGGSCEIQRNIMAKAVLDLPG